MQVIDTASLFLAWIHVPEDMAVTGSAVWRITNIEVREKEADAALKSFEHVRDQTGVGLISCRLDHACLNESMFLERHGFRFIEMLYQPELVLETAISMVNGPLLQVRQALQSDLPTVFDIAGNAFVNERFHIDPRLGPKLGNLRYQNWVKSSFSLATQQLYVLSDKEKLVAFFVTEMLADNVCYWHLNAVAPDAQGQGYGRRAWQTMIKMAADKGAKRIRTSIVARNHLVLNLYARLGFMFPAPQMTFHWVRGNGA